MQEGSRNGVLFFKVTKINVIKVKDPKFIIDLHCNLQNKHIPRLILSQITIDYKDSY